MVLEIGYILIGLAIITALVLGSLWLFEKKLKKKVIEGRNTRNDFYIEKIAKMDASNPSRTLMAINKIAKNFFIEAFKIKSAMDYSELKDFFDKKNNKKTKRFCEIMTEIYYAKENVDKKQIKELTNLLAEIISSNHIISKEEKKELDKKSQIKQKELETRKKTFKAN